MHLKNLWDVWRREVGAAEEFGVHLEKSWLSPCIVYKNYKQPAAATGYEAIHCGSPGCSVKPAGRFKQPPQALIARICVAAENVNNNRFRRKNKKFARASHSFLYFSLPFLHGYNVKLTNFTFCGKLKQATTKFYFSFWTWVGILWIQLQGVSPTFDIVYR